MPRLDLVVETTLSRSGRVRQIEAMFDVPASEVTRLSWSAELPLDERPWNIGLITGPSGAGKSTCLRALFGPPVTFEWAAPSVLDDFAMTSGLEQIAAVCQAVGFNTIPAWLRPFRVLSMGEQFRVMMARTLLEAPGDPLVIDEFTSVVDRQVALIAAYAVQKYVRARARRLVAATCHADVEAWLQPDWVFEPATTTFRWRALQRRPELVGVIQRVPYAAWALFSPFHYLTRELHRSARCFGLFVGEQMAAFAALLHRPHPRVRDIMGISRVVTHPDWQGLGLAFRLMDTLAGMYRAVGKRVHMYPAHPGFIRSFAKSPAWICVKRPGSFSTRSRGDARMGSFGGRPCAVFAYVGPAWPDTRAARTILDGVAA
mgnify:CR=1 FL=1